MYLYRPPTGSNVYDCLENILSSCSLCQEWYIPRDISRDVSWQDNNYLLKSLDSLMKTFTLNQLIDSPTRITDSCISLIDLNLVSDPRKVFQTDTLPFCFSLSSGYIEYEEIFF